MGIVIRKPRHRAAIVAGVNYKWFKIVGARQIHDGSYVINLTGIKINEMSPTLAYAESQYSGSYPASNAIDNNTTTAWVSSQAALPTDTWLAVNMSAATTCIKLSLYPYGPLPTTLFTYFDFYGSNDSTNGADGTWKLIASGLTRSDNTARWHEWEF